MAGKPLRWIVIGIGNPDRGDDGAGRAVTQLLRGTLPEDVTVLDHDGETSGLIAALDGVAAAYLVDACVSGAPAGAVRRFDVNVTKLSPSAFGLSSHGLGLAEAVELARSLGQLPACCIVYAIEGQSFSVGTSLSSPVATAVGTVAARLRVEIEARW